MPRHGHMNWARQKKESQDRAHNLVSDNKFQCPECPETFKNETRYRRHFRSTHTKIHLDPGIAGLRSFLLARRVQA